MSDTMKVSSWDDLGDLLEPGVAIINLPNVSEKIGSPFNVKVRAITPAELWDILDFPLDEVNRLAEQEDGAVKAAVDERWQVMSVEDRSAAVLSTIKIGMVEPEPTEENIKRIAYDAVTMFTKIMELSKPEDAESQARFHQDGEQSSD